MWEKNSRITKQCQTTIEFFLYGQNFQWIQRIQGIWQITEAWIGLNLKIPSLICVLLVLWWHPGLLHRRWQVRANSVKHLGKTPMSLSKHTFWLWHCVYKISSLLDNIRNNKKTFQLNADRALSDRPCFIVNKSECVGGEGGPCAVKYKLNKFEHVSGGCCRGTSLSRQTSRTENITFRQFRWMAVIRENGVFTPVLRRTVAIVWTKAILLYWKIGTVQRWVLYPFIWLKLWFLFSGGSKGDARDAPGVPNYFNFMQFLGNFG